MVLLIEKLSEYKSPLWACTIDFQKAFDTVEWAHLWRALASQGVPRPYIALMSRLYRNQVGQVVGRTVSKSFAISRGTKQGDPLSPSLFNAVLEAAMKEIKSKWCRKGWGIKVEGDMWWKPVDKWVWRCTLARPKY
eukprot:10726980-Karenia_brevis.AAC.1